jgi:hypothetical protein
MKKDPKEIITFFYKWKEFIGTIYASKNHEFYFQDIFNGDPKKYGMRTVQEYIDEEWIR